MYRYQLSKKADNIVFRGHYQQVEAWLRENLNGSQKG
jgi:tRNA 2-selenouridine synthase